VHIRPKSLLPIVLIFLFGGSVTDAAAQGITEFLLPAGGRAYGITAGPDGNVWFTKPEPISALGGSIGRITPGGGVTEFSASGLEPRFIVTGPDGNLWFTADDECDNGISNIGRITPAGVGTFFGQTFCRLMGDIAVGSDGNLWFTWTAQSVPFVFTYGISRITPAGERTDFPLPGAHGIAAGPDGAIWFTEGNPLGHSWGPNGVDRIGRITTEGVISEFALPAGSAPAGIVTGPDGNLWFTEASGKKIGRITPLGTVTEFPVPTAGSRPLYITSCPDGNLWFTEFVGNKIGRITTSGVITEFPIPTPGAGAVDITAGPDGNIWFTENGNNQIGRLSVVRGPTLETRILPVVGSTAGVGGSFFRTAVQLHNPTGSSMTGQVVFHRSGSSGSSSDPLLAYTLAPGQTQSIADLLPAMGRSGLGSADIEVTAGSVPTVTVRVFNDAGAAGTTGFTEQPMRAEDTLQAGQSGVLLLPADLTGFRFNLGVRTVEGGAAATLTVRDPSGAVVATVPRAFPATYHEQQSAPSFLGISTLPAGGSISIAVSAGAAIFYGATVDNTTGDPSLQVARAAS
jgi:streptogramin lyase